MKRRLLIAALLLGLAEFGYGTWIPAKAWLSQVLLEHSWQETLSDHTLNKPWPWADTRPVLQLEFAKDQQRFIVLESDSGQSLAFGPGMLASSMMPGEAGNTVISGHRDTHFRFLQTVGTGDRVTLKDRYGLSHHYEVTDMQIIDSSKTQLWLNTEDDRLTLVTCYPFDAIVAGGDLRYVVNATRI